MPRCISVVWRLLIVAVLAVALPAATRAQLLTGSITGLVTSQSTNAPIAGATVSAAGRTTSTNAQGRYTLTSLPTGSQTVTASAPSYTSASVTVTVALFQTRTAPTLALSSSKGTVSGTVKNSATGLAIAGATVSIANSSLITTTNASGQYSIAGVSTGTQTVTVSASGYNSVTQSGTVAAGQTLTLNFALSAVASGSANRIVWNGGAWYVLGANYAWYNYGTDFGTGGWGKYTDWSSVGSGFSTLNTQGARVVRYWLFADGRYAPDFAADGSVSGLDSSVLTDIDQILAAANRANVYLLLCVVDGSMWGNASYSGAVQMGGHATLVTSTTVQQTFLDNALKPVLQRVASSAYRNRVLGYDIVNEPESNMSGYWGGVNLSASAVQTFVRNCATYIHSYGGGAYATVGSATPYYVSTWKNLGLDFYQIHYYPWMDFSNGAGSGLPTYASLGLDKPCIVGEFATNDANYNLGDTTPLSAQWYLDSIYSKGYAGALGWSYFVGDSASNWNSFAPILTNWVQSHALIVGP